MAWYLKKDKNIYIYDVVSEAKVKLVYDIVSDVSLLSNLSMM